MFKNLSNLEEVKEYELGEVCRILSGISFKKSQYVKSGVPILNVRNIQDGKINGEGCLFCNQENHKNLIWVKSGDVVVARAGSAGKIGINRTNREFVLNENIFKLEVNEEILNRRYLYHFLANCERQISSIVKPGIIPLLTKSSFAKLNISVPPLRDQEKIAYQLDKFMELKKELKKELRLRKKQHDYYREQIINHLTNVIEGKSSCSL